MSEHIASRKFYVLIWAALMLLTALTAGLSFIDLGRGSVVVALLIAGTKATLVVLFFMHMRWSDPVTRGAAVAGLIWLFVMFALTAGDFFTRGWPLYPRQ